MSITISNCDEICHSPVNSSKSKMLYSFSKSSRFPQRRRIMYVFIHLGVINSMIHIQSVPVEPQPLDLDINMISPNSQHVPLLLMHTASMTNSPKI